VRENPEAKNRLSQPYNLFRYALILILSGSIGALNNGCNKQMPAPARITKGQCNKGEGSFTVNENITRCHLFDKRKEFIETVETGGENKKYCTEANYISCEIPAGFPVWPKCENPLRLLSGVSCNKAMKRKE